MQTTLGTYFPRVRKASTTVSIVSIDGWRLFRFVLLVIVGLVGMGLVVAVLPLISEHKNVFGLVPFFHLDKEGNIPTYFSSMMLLVAAGLAGTQAMLTRVESGKWWDRWGVLAVGFAWMSMDEIVSLHEKLDPLIMARWDLSGTLFHYPWAVAAVPVVLVVAVYMWPMLCSLPPQHRHALMIAGGVYLTGAIGIELPEGWYAAHYTRASVGYQLMAAFEEGLEMVGCALVLRGLVAVLASRVQGFVVRIQRV